MKPIKRFALVCDDQTHLLFMQEDSEGAWVRAEDIEALLTNMRHVKKDLEQGFPSHALQTLKNMEI